MMSRETAVKSYVDYVANDQEALHAEFVWLVKSILEDPLTAKEKVEVALEAFEQYE